MYTTKNHEGHLSQNLRDNKIKENAIVITYDSNNNDKKIALQSVR